MEKAEGPSQDERKHASTLTDEEGIPRDLLWKLQHDFKQRDEYETALALINRTREAPLNVGWIQLSRAMLILAKGDVNKIKELIDSHYLGDPRDVLLGVDNYGRTPFDMKD